MSSASFGKSNAVAAGEDMAPASTKSRPGRAPGRGATETLATMTPQPHAFPVLDPALFGNVGGHNMVVIDLRAETGGVDPFDAIRDIVERGDAACLYDRQGEWSDCVVGKVDGGHFVVTAADRGTFADLGAARRFGLKRATSLSAHRKKRSRFGKLCASLKLR